MGTLGRIWDLYKQSFDVLCADAEILLFPILSGISAMMVAAGFFIPMFYSGTLETLGRQPPTLGQSATLFAWYFLHYFFVIFFNSALVGCANIRLGGGDPTVRDGLRIAGNKLTQIAAWAIVAATVGWLFRSLQSGRNRIGRLLTAGLGLAWTLITYLIIPVIILEDRTVFDSMQRSAQLFRERWGEQIAGSFGFGLINVFLFLPAVAIGWLLSLLDPALGIIFAVCYLLILSVITSAVRGVFTVALYRYASDGQAPRGFSTRMIDNALGVRRAAEWDFRMPGS